MTFNTNIAFSIASLAFLPRTRGLYRGISVATMNEVKGLKSLWENKVECIVRYFRFRTKLGMTRKYQQSAMA